MKRLPPAPTKTALARLVRCIVDAMPWVMARDLRAARTDLARVRKLNSELRDENYHLQEDYDNLMHGSLLPMPDYTSLRFDQCQDEPVMVLNVEYPRLNAAVVMRRGRGIRISPFGAQALHEAASRVAQATVRPHRDALIQRVLGGKTIEQVIKESQHG